MRREERRVFSNVRALTACILALHVAALVACAQSSRQQRPQRPEGRASSANSAAGTRGPARYQINPAELPPPFHTESARNPPRVVPRPEGARLNLPPGFSVEVFAEGDFVEPRWMALAPNGDVFVADSRPGKIHVLRDTNSDGWPDARFVFAEGLTQPLGMAFHGGYFYVANTNAVVRFAYKSGQTKAAGPPEKIADLPGLGYRQHWTRNVIFRPDGKKMYVSVGSESNVSVEPEPMRAAITEYNPDGTGKRIFASGLRNPVGLAFYPGTHTLWTTVNERDGLGDRLVPDYLTSVRDGAFYGWPYAYIGRNVDPRRKGERPELVEKTIVPDLLIESHSAALGLVFYDGKAFPEEYRGDAFVALRGSWNRSEPTGYKIIRVPFRNGKPVGHYEDFLTGWLTEGENAAVWGRPVGLLVNADGSLLITDDGANKIWRVTYARK